MSMLSKSGKLIDDSPILIYGIGGNGSGLYERLSKNGCHVVAFIDKRADEISDFRGLPVYLPEQIEHVFQEKGEFIVFITLKNVFAHSSIAKFLLEIGFSYLVYKSDSILKNAADENELEIDRLYETYIEKKTFVSDGIVPKTENISFVFRNRLFIEEQGELVNTWCPVELLFNYVTDEDYPRINMPLFFPIVELYKFLLGDPTINREEALDNFFVYSSEWLKRNNRELDEAQKKSFIESRVSIFQEMQKLAEVDIDFFKRNSPVVTYIDGRFYMSSSGRNRVCFLIAKGFKYVPVRMTKNDYETWCNIEYVNTVKKKIEKENITSLFAPFPNPYLVDFMYQFSDYQRLILWPIANTIFKKIYKESRVQEGTLVTVSQKLVEEKKREISIGCMIDDGNVASQYFNSIDLTTIAHSEAKHIVYIIDSRKKNINFSEMNFDNSEIYYICIGDNNLDDIVEVFNPSVIDKMIETVAICGNVSLYHLIRG